ncbi:hypothetical protein AC249_AIPGENE25432 [Exaiptasia diaphana]|nr:hypothetical protein AC249_AIPGENE25432 [Exaiptasia diaphana]
MFWNPESSAWNPESSSSLDSLTWGEKAENPRERLSSVEDRLLPGNPGISQGNSWEIYRTKIKMLRKGLKQQQENGIKAD